MQTVLKQDRITNLKNRLTMFRQQIGLRLLVLLSAKSESQAQSQADMHNLVERSHKDIVEIIAVNGKTLQSTLGAHETRVLHLHEDAEVRARRMHEEIIAAILTLRDGDTEVIRLSGSDKAAFGWTDNSMIIKESIQHNESAGRRSEVVFDDFSFVPTRVLDCLYFRQMTDRVDEVALAHQRTFEWIFRNPVTDQKPWTNFLDWLRYATGCYWINGKAGSGKSTLMRYIYEDARTTTALELWAGQGTLITSSFFFWNLGSPLQKTQSGLLRSLLFDILERHQGLIPSVFPRLCRAILANKTAMPLVEPSFAELRQAFLKLVGQASISLKMCFFIDGIDEFDGIFEELLELIMAISSSPYVKFVLSSRPIPICVDFFSQHAKLRLQDLTHDDIRLYVEDKLAGNVYMSRLKKTEGALATNLVTEVCDKASGVFLWVMLVVRSLLQGLRNFDRISDLRHRLEELPADLESLYQHMLCTMSPLYRQQASQLFQIMMNSRNVQDERPVTLLQLSFAEEEDTMMAVRASVGPLPKSAQLSRCEETEGRLRSRCCGLLEVQDKRVYEKNARPVVRPCVGFLHKTVVEFLQLPDNWTNISGLNANTTFDPFVSLMASCLYDLKTSTPDDHDIYTIASDGLWPICRNMLLYAMLAEQSTNRAQTAFVDELDQTMEALLQQTGPQNPSQARWTWCIGLHQSFMSLAVKFGLSLYLEDKLSQEHFGALRGRHTSRVFLLQEAICAFFSTLDHINGKDARTLRNLSGGYRPDYSIPLPLFVDIVRTVLEYGGDANRVPASISAKRDLEAARTPWELFLNYVCGYAMQRSRRWSLLEDFSQSSPLFLITWLFRLFVVHGAKLSASDRYRRSPLQSIKDLLTSKTGQWRSPECRALVQDALDELTALMADRREEPSKAFSPSIPATSVAPIHSLLTSNVTPSTVGAGDTLSRKTLRSGPGTMHEAPLSDEKVTLSPLTG
jgi:hypothetical protein